MIHIPQLTLGTEEYKATIKRDALLEKDFEKFRFLIFINDNCLGSLTWEHSYWSISYVKTIEDYITIDDIHIIIVELQKHIAKHDRRGYLYHRLPVDPEIIRYAVYPYYRNQFLMPIVEVMEV